MVHFPKKFPKLKFRDRGVSLMYVVVVGGITASAALALGSSLFPIYNHVSSLTQRDQVIDISENCLRYAMARFKQLHASGEDLQTVNIDKLMPPDALRNQSTVQISLSDADLATLKNRGVYSDDQSVYPSAIILPTYKFLTITTSKGGYSHKIRVLLEPKYTLPSFVSPDEYPNSAGNTLVSSTLFSDAALQANSTLRIGDGVDVSIEGGKDLGANIGSNGLITLDGTSTINGSINAYSPPISNGTPTSIKATQNAIIKGNVSASGNISDVNPTITTPPLSSDASGGNVFGDGIQGSTPTAGVIDNSSKLTQMAPVVTPQPTQEAQINGTFAEPGDISMPTGATVTDLGALRVPAGQTVTIQPGNYVVDSLSVESGGTLSIKSSPSDSSSGLNLYVRGSSETSVPVDVQGSVSFNGTTISPNNFQLFYSGQKSLNFGTSNNSSLYGLVYAPNASINVGLGANSSFHGALVGNNVSVQKSGTSIGPRSIVYDPNATNVAPPSSSGTAPAPQFSLMKNSSGTGYAVLDYRIISWEEPL
ncbi:MAG: hypothetical protein K2Y39_00110 [Candidatus Obscuribacterales bacterium]|nr:hypothetical protein [Candidatus Obscuribacterales bacterium]